MLARTKWGLPDFGPGIGFRTCHYQEILDRTPDLGFLEIISENYLGNLPRRHAMLESLSRHYPITLHGVSLSIGSTDPIDFKYLRRLKDLADRVRAPWVSDHICWTGVSGRNTHDLLPLPYTEESLAHVVERTRAVSEFLGRPLVLENPSSYLEFRGSTMSEQEFVVRLIEEADCGLLLDVNNVYVSARNHGFDPVEWIDAMPGDRIVQVHLAGHTDLKTHLLDTHDGPVAEGVWALYDRLVGRIGNVPSMIEWDDAIPSLATIENELRIAAARREPEVSLARA